MTRPIWNRETMSGKDYQDALVRFLKADLPYYQFAPSQQLIVLLLLERLANAEAEVEKLRGIVSHQDAQIVEGSQADGEVKHD
jgi:hypothetical protein